MTFSVTMPALGESVTEGTVTRWLKKEGESVAVDEPLLEVSTDKVDTEIPSPAAGVLQKIVVGPDQTVPVGAELAIIETGASAATSTPAPTAVKKSETLNIVGKSSEIALGETKIFSENDPYGRGARYVITRTKAGLVAFDNTCTHEGCGIETIISKNQLQCKCHGAEFDAITGEALRKPAYEPLKSVKVSELNGEILIGQEA